MPPIPISPQAWQLLLVLGLSFLLGLEREGRKAKAGHYIFGGVRTFPLIGLLGYSVALLAGSQVLPVMLGFLGVAAFLAISYWHKITQVGEAGVTTEISGLVTYVLGSLVAGGWYWLATALVVLSMLLLELKAGLENLADRIPSAEILTLTKFLLLTAVVLPLVPNRSFTEFGINPFRLWLVVVAVSGLSYVSYLLQWRLGEKVTLTSSALLGGLYSSTLVAVILARRSKELAGGVSYAAAVLLASSVMYVRVLVLLELFQPTLALMLVVPLLGLAAVGGGASALWLWLASRHESRPSSPRAAVNPLELSTAFLFAAVFLVLTVGTRWVVGVWGEAGVYALSFLAGAVDVDPYVMSLSQQAGESVVVSTAARAVLLALSGNQVAKGIYALALGHRPMGRAALVALLLLAAAGLLPLVWL